MAPESDTKKTHMGPAIRIARTRKVGVKAPETARERVPVILSRYREASIAVVAVVLVVYFQIGSSGAFLSPQELSVVLRDTGRFGLIAVAQVMLMITGEIDLSVGSTFSLAPYTMVLMSIGWGLPLAIGAIAGVVLGVLIGVVNGVITVGFRVPSLITTVGTLFLLQGVVVSIYNSQPIVAPVQSPSTRFSGRISTAQRIPSGLRTA